MFNQNPATTDETLQKIFSSIFIQLFKDNLSPPDQIQSGLRAVLNKKKSRCSNNSEYIQTLLQNVGYFVIFNEQVFSFYKNFLDKKNEISIEQLNEQLVTLQQQVKASEPQWITRFHTSFSKIPNENLKIDELEFCYIYNSMLNQILLTSIAEFTCNQKLLSHLTGANPEKVIATYTSHAVFYTNMSIGNIKAA